jgi:hypothetical protein
MSEESGDNAIRWSDSMPGERHGALLKTTPLDAEKPGLHCGAAPEVGWLERWMKETMVYLGAQPAKEAALRVERFCKSSGGTPAEAEEAINAIEHECIALKAALCKHPLAVEPT